MFSMLDLHLLNLKSVFVITCQLYMLMNKKVCEMVNENKHDFKDLAFVAIEKVQLVNGGDVNISSLTREAYWMAHLYIYIIM